MDDWVGKTLSKVRIDRIIGRGGMADVYLGEHITLDRPMAVKILHAHMTDEPDLRRRFQEEAKAVASLRHPNIVQVIDFDVLEDRPYIVMELLEGMSLATYLRALHNLGHSLPLDTISRLIHSIASALDYAHGRGIVHRDVKPANIVLRKGAHPIQPDLPLAADVEPILTDFGVARIASSATRTASGTVLGTPAYMSPEQVMGQVVDARSDIYALGIILYEMLAGRLPFDPDTDTPASILYKHVHEPAPQLPNLASPVAQVVHKALAKDKEQRYQRAGLLAAELGASITSPPTSAGITRQATPSSLPQVSTPPPMVADSVPSPTEATPTAARTRVGGSGLSGIALVGAFGLGAAVLAGGVFLGVMILRGVLSGPSPTAEPAATGVAVAQPTLAPPTDSPPTAQVPQLAPNEPELDRPRGTALLHDSDLAATIDPVDPPPEGHSYHAWLTGPEPVAPLHINPIGTVDWVDGRLLVEYLHSGPSSLLGTYDSVAITLEPGGGELFDPGRVVFRASFLPEEFHRLRTALEVNRGAPVLANLLERGRRQAVHLASHAGFAAEAIRANSLAGARQHSEHTINIAVGEGDERFRDWDGNGTTENPGDKVGLLSYLHLLESAARGYAQAQELAGRVDNLPDQVAREATALVNSVGGLVDNAQQVVGSDEMAVVHELELEPRLAEAQAIRQAIEGLMQQASALDLTISLTFFIAPPSQG